ncbi:MAG: bifunctional DNA primase/polymerase [Kineosporiaceae bacterium]|nr:bifunctional DNA primase/polymerase [Kineosporiaceae bacterium]
MKPLESALRMASRGWFVFPVEPGGKRPAIRAAHAGSDGRAGCRGECGRDGHGLHDATTSPERIRSWWASYPRANVGVSCGPSKVVVIDLDTAKGERPATVLADQGDEQTPDDVLDGVGVLRWLSRRHGRPGDLATAHVWTPTGGLHLYFAAPPTLEVTSGAGISGGLGWQVDVRAHGGYVVGAWSQRPEGLYRPSRGLGVAQVPPWLLDRLVFAGRVPSMPPPRPAKRGGAQANVAQLPAYLRSAIAGEVQSVLDAVEGERNHTLNRAAFKLGQLVAAHQLDEETATQALSIAAATAGLSEGEAASTIRSGMNAGARHPRTTGALT